MYYIWFDESDKDGKFFSNFYGGILIRSTHLKLVLGMMQDKINELNITEEIKWQKVNAFVFDKYIQIVDFIFDLLEHDYIKIRIFFRNNQYAAVGLTREQQRNAFPLLYYQFIKHAFGLQYSNDTDTPVQLRLLIDDIPLKGEDKDTFKNYIYKLNNDPGFKQAKIQIKKENICEVDSSKHIPLQFMDLILGAICFRLNDKHKIKDNLTNKRGKRTIIKEKLYKHINKRIRDLRPGFNIGESTGITTLSDRWEYAYSHWSFKSTEYTIDTSISKKKK